MSIPLPFRKRSQREQVRQDWIDERLCEARMVVADVVNHSDHMLRLACTLLARHGETPEEREDARILLTVVDARTSQHHGYQQRADRDDFMEGRR